MLITDKEELKKYSSAHRLWQGIPSVAVTHGGRIYVAFYSGGETEQLGNYIVLVRSDDGGKNFTEPIAVAYNGDGERAYDPSLWVDPTGKLWLFWAVMPNNRIEFATCAEPDTEEPVWSGVRFLPGEVMLNKPIVLRDGTYLFPAAVWEHGLMPVSMPVIEGAHGRLETGAYAVASRDGGKTFEIRGHIAAENRCFDEHMFLERDDGAIEIYIRTYYGIAKSISYDGGYTWGKDTDSRLGGPNSRFHITRLPSGNVLLVNHYKFRARNNLTAMISCDEGSTFGGFLRIDERNEVSYPDVAEHDGKLYIVHDRERGARYEKKRDYSYAAREILISVLTEGEIANGKLSHPDSFLCGTVSRLKKD